MAYKPVEIIQLAGDAGKYKAELSVPNFLVRGFMAGLFIAVGAATSRAPSPRNPANRWRNRSSILLS